MPAFQFSSSSNNEVTRNPWLMNQIFLQIEQFMQHLTITQVRGASRQIISRLPTRIITAHEALRRLPEGSEQQLQKCMICSGQR